MKEVETTTTTPIICWGWWFLDNHWIHVLEWLVRDYFPFYMLRIQNHSNAQFQRLLQYCSGSEDIDPYGYRNLHSLKWVFSGLSVSIDTAAPADFWTEVVVVIPTSFKWSSSIPIRFWHGSQFCPPLWIIIGQANLKSGLYLYNEIIIIKIQGSLEGPVSL